VLAAAAGSDEGLALVACHLETQPAADTAAAAPGSTG
jgi:hypothetical protein